MKTSLAIRYQDVLRRIEAAAQRSQRSASDIRLIAVSKLHTVESMQELFALGQSHFGENYVQEAKEKRDSLPPGAALHLIGHLQRNKAKEAVRIFDLIHSVDRISLAEELAKAAQAIGKVQRILIQVKVSEEESKSGCAVDLLFPLVESILSLPSLRLQGLMCIGRYSPDGVPEAERREEFRLLVRLLDELQHKFPAKSYPGAQEIKELSMGMSEDFEVAVEEGATLVRVGSLIFGPRAQSV